MSEQFVDVLLDGTSIRENLVSFRLQRPRNRATDSLTIRLGDFSLYSQFDFTLVPTEERLHVGTSTASPKTDGSTVGTNIFTSAGSDFTAEGVTIDDIIFVIESTESADLGGHEITVVGTTTLTSSFTFGTASSIRFIILKNQGRFFVEKPDVVESEEDIAIPSLWGRNGVARLTDPFVNKLTKTYTRKQNFSELVTELVTEAGMDASKVIIDIDDFVIPGNLLTVSNQVPLDVIINLCRKTNGYARSQKTGDLHIKKDIFHFGALPIAQALGDDEVRELQERNDYPTFGNRVLVRSVTPEAAQDVRISLSVETACTRGDGKSPVPARAVVTNQRGLPVPDGTAVEWNITAADGVQLVFTVSRGTTLTGEETFIDEFKRSQSLLTVSTEFPIKEVLGVYLKMDRRKQTNFFEGGSFQGTAITLGRELPFSNTQVAVDYVAGGITRNTIRSFAGVTEGTVNFVNASVGRIRDTVTLCVNNNRNLSLSLVADPSEVNLCPTGGQNVTITAAVRDNGETGQLVAINWRLLGLGSLSTSFSIVQNAEIESEMQTSQNLFTVNTRYPISSVVGVFDAEEGQGGTNLFTNSSQRTGSFEDRQIILGTNLPNNRTRVEIRYFAISVAQISYTAPLGETGPSVAFVVAEILDGTEFGIVEQEEILLNFICPDENGVVPGVNPATGLPTERRQLEPDCDRSTACARSSNIGSPDLATFTENVCKCLNAGQPCPNTEDECRTLCESDYNASGGLSSFLCSQEGQTEFCRRETGNRSLQALQDCRDGHKPATVDKCIERCLDHEADSDLTIDPEEANMDCGSDQFVQFTANGGGPPYTWETTNGTLDVSELTTVAQLRSNSNDGNFVSGTAYRKHRVWGKRCFPPFGGFCCWREHRNDYTCDDTALGGCEGGGEGINPACDGANPFCSSPSLSCGQDGDFVAGSCDPGQSCPNFPDNCELTCANLDKAYTCVIDTRTGPMIAADCNPCAITMDGGAIVTVTDSFGKQAMATVQINEDL
jgi:hypothetical protein